MLFHNFSFFQLIDNPIKDSFFTQKFADADDIIPPLISDTYITDGGDTYITDDGNTYITDGA